MRRGLGRVVVRRGVRTRLFKGGACIRHGAKR